MTSLLTIPLELLVAVSTYLPTSDLASFRLTCNHVERSLYEWFSEEFFSKKQFMLTHKSLQALVDISRHGGFSKRLKHVIFATHIYNASTSHSQFRNEEAKKRYKQGYKAQKALLSTGVDREMLTEAFQNLVNLHTVGIRDFNAPSRTRDGRDARWTAWGSTSVYKETGIMLSFSGNIVGTELGSSFLYHIFTTIHYALGKASRCPAELEVLLRSKGLPDSAFDLPDFLLPTMEPVLKSYKSLLLNVDFSSDNLFSHGMLGQLDTSACHDLRHFLKYTPNLFHLRLNFEKQLVEKNTEFLEWLALAAPDPAQQHPYNHMGPCPIALPLLSKLELGQLKLQPATLLAVIAKFAPTLRSLSLWRMALYILQEPDSFVRLNLWADLFQALAKVPKLELTHLKAGMLQQDCGTGVMHVHFYFEGDDTEPAMRQVEYSGKDMEEFLYELTGWVGMETPSWLAHHEEPMNDYLSNEDSEEGEDEEDSENDE